LGENQTSFDQRQSKFVICNIRNWDLLSNFEEIGFRLCQNLNTLEKNIFKREISRLNIKNRAQHTTKVGLNCSKWQPDVNRGHEEERL
jgi:predicted phosphohydrolase